MGLDLNKYASLVSDVTCLLNGDDFKKRRKDLGLSLGHYHRGAYPLALISKLHGSRSAESVRRICNEDAYAKAVLQVRTNTVQLVCDGLTPLCFTVVQVLCVASGLQRAALRV